MSDLSLHKQSLRDYFNGLGFARWAAIYGEGALDSRVRRTIRAGHAEMLALAERWLFQGSGVRGQGSGTGGQTPDPRPLTPDPATKVLDAGCGTGLFAITAARRGCAVTAVDIAPAMVAAASEAAQRAGVADRIRFATGDLEAIDGEYDAVTCFDVLVHYPQPAFAQMLAQLAQRTRSTLLITYAPYSTLLAALHWLGGRFPQGQRRTEIQMIRDADVRAALAAAGMHVRRTARISRGFYHVTLLEAARDA